MLDGRNLQWCEHYAIETMNHGDYNRYAIWAIGPLINNYIRIRIIHFTSRFVPIGATASQRRCDPVGFNFSATFLFQPSRV